MMGDEVGFEEGDSTVVDFSEVEDSSFEVLPKGMFPVVVAECEFTFSQAKGNPMWTLQLQVEDGDFEDRLLFSHMVFAGKALPMTKRQLARIRPDLMEGPFDPQDEDIISSMLGLRLICKVGHQKYDGETRNNVKDLFPNDE